MKLGTVLASVSAAVLVMAQPAAAATRSAASLPSVTADAPASASRLGSPVGQSENLVFGSVAFWVVVAIIGFVAAMALVISDDNDDDDGLPDSP